jgi:50S ribosomal protein L16 3-hydroxylase
VSGDCAFLAPGLLGEDDAAARLERFLSGYWRRRPLLLPGALEGFEIPLDGDELAGLACEPEADARIVRSTVDGYVLEQGPFDPARFATIGDRDWTLLVNGVDLAVPGFEPLLDAVRFAPDWRLDDVMVSFAAPGGSVGPHLDRYDVFLLQAEGTRRWELGPDPAEERRPLVERGGLALVEDFLPRRSERCGPGDGLYVPAGCVHHGIAETPSLTLSIGFRAPTLADLVDDWTLGRIELLPTLPMDLDPPLPTNPALLAPETVAAARAALRAALLAGLDDTDFVRRLGALLTEAGRGARFFEPDPLTAPELAAELAAGALLERAPGVRLLLWADPAHTLIFAAGQCHETHAAAAALEPLTRLTPLGARDLTDAATLEAAAELYNRGLLLLTEPGS